MNRSSDKHLEHSEVYSALTFASGHSMKNRFSLAPLTNQQSHPDGSLSEDEFNWLTKRAKGGFGLTMTCASHVQAIGQGFPGQLGIYSDKHIPGHQKLAAAIKAEGSLAIIQLHHAGMRSPNELIKDTAVCPSDNSKHEARALSLTEISNLKNDFIQAAQRAQKAGYDGVEVHGAHGYILSQFLSSSINLREDQYGGSLSNRTRLIVEILEGIRENCGKHFLLGLRLSPERFGMKLSEIKSICLELASLKLVDFLDISLWDVYKMPEEEEHHNQSLLEHFGSLKLGEVKLTVAGKISDASSLSHVLNHGVDFVSIGKAAILHYDFPEKLRSEPNFTCIQTPVSEEYLKEQGLGPSFVEYMKRWPGFVDS